MSQYVKIIKRRALRALNCAPGADYPHPVVCLSEKDAQEIRDALFLVECDHLLDMSDLILNSHKIQEIREVIEGIDDAVC